MIKFTRSKEAVALAWTAFILLLVCSILIAYRWSLTDFLIVFCVFEVPAFVVFPLCCQTIKIDDHKIGLNLWLIKLRTFSWSEVSEIGIAYTRAGYGTYKKYIYISKRPVTDKERFDILHVKDHKNFITMENRGNIIEDLKKYSKLPFRDLPTTEDFNNM